MKAKYFERTQNISCFPGFFSPIFCPETRTPLNTSARFLQQKLKNSTYSSVVWNQNLIVKYSPSKLKSFEFQ